MERADVVARFLKGIYEYAQISPTRRIAVDAVGLLIALTVAWFIYIGLVRQARIATQGKEAHDYLCYQKQVVIPGRVQVSLDYINAVERGIRKPVPGITFADIQTGIDRDEKTLNALARVHC